MLTKQRALELAGLDPARKVCAKVCESAHTKVGCKFYPTITEAAALDLVAKVEREVLLHQAVLVGDLSKALNSCRVSLDGTRFESMEYDRDLVNSAKKAAKEFLKFTRESNRDPE